MKRIFLIFIIYGDKMRSVFYVTALLFFSLNIYAAPGIPSFSSGTLEHNETVVISGSSFGSKSTAGPMWYDNFDAGTTSADIEGESPTIDNCTDSSTWSSFLQGGNDNPNTYNASTYYGNDGKAAFHDCTGQNTCALRVFVDESDRAYLTFNWYYHKNGSSNPDNNKFFIWRNYSEDASYQYFSMGEPGTGDESLRYHWVWSLSGYDTEYLGKSLYDFDDHWIRVEVVLDQSSTGSADGSVTALIHYYTGSAWVISELYNNNSMRTRSGSMDLYDNVDYGYYFSRKDANTHSQIYSDNFYYDNTWARVELGNASSWAACTKREIQIPTAWSASEITITFNQGAFATDDTVWVYVCDSNNVCTASSSTYTIGQEIGSTPNISGVLVD
jgi:hypothetical protein